MSDTQTAEPARVRGAQKTIVNMERDTKTIEYKDKDGKLARLVLGSSSDQPKPGVPDSSTLPSPEITISAAVWASIYDQHKKLIDGWTLNRQIRVLNLA